MAAPDEGSSLNIPSMHKKQHVQDEYIEPPAEELDQINLDKLHPERTVLIGAGCTGSLRQHLIEFLLFYDILRKSQKFEWTADHEQAFRDLKHYLSNPPLLSKPEPGEPLFLYLAVTEVAVSAVLVREQDKEQKPVYYVSKTNYPLKSITSKPELSGRMSKWSVHLSGYDIRYESRTAIKSQALTNFVSDFSPAIQNLADEEILTLKGSMELEIWQMHIDGASN
ncbi:uncharacterized protein LOC141646491 [Silene latifolia]|uniref:uncharacterized protein LOC141646491 n=1 Tax=Silene latifolia TaxID=37657 RepID=UPI003D77D6C7